MDGISSYYDDFCLGCPFRHTDLDLLKQKLKSMSIGTEYYDKVRLLVIRKSYFLRKLWKITFQKLKSTLVIVIGTFCLAKYVFL